MESIQFTDGDFIVSPINSNLIISKKTHECVAIVMSGKYNGLAFTDDRVKKQNNAKLLAKSKEMHEFLVMLSEIIPRNNNTSGFGNCWNENINGTTIGEAIEYLIKL